MAARELGYPVALKIVSPRLPQKSSVGGVALDIVDKASPPAPRPADARSGRGRGAGRADRGAAGAAHGALAGAARALSRRRDRPDLRPGPPARPRRPAVQRHRRSSTCCRRWIRPWPTPCSTRRRSAASCAQQPDGQAIVGGSGRDAGPAVRPGGRASRSPPAGDRSAAGQPRPLRRARRPCRAGAPRPPTPARASPSGPIRASSSRPPPCATAARSACGRSGPRMRRRCSSCSTASRPRTGACGCSPRCARCPTSSRPA